MLSIFDKVIGKNNGGRDNRHYGTNGKEATRALANPSEGLRKAPGTDGPDDASNYEVVLRERGS